MGYLPSSREPVSSGRDFVEDSHVLSVEELREEVERGAIDTVVVAFTDMQGRLMGKRVDGEYFLEDSVEHGVEGCNYLLALEMEMDPVPGYAIASWEQGYGDFRLVPDLATLRREPWPGQQEINFRYADALTMADNHAIYKNGAKEIAHLNGCSITFMAKPDHTWIGSSSHIHSSLWREGESAFAGGGPLFDKYLAG